MLDEEFMACFEGKNFMEIEAMVRCEVADDMFLCRMSEVPAGLSGRHPNGQTVLEHGLIVAAMCFNSGYPARIVAAGFLHDIGKLLTPQEKWPHHVGHDVLGATWLAGNLYTGLKPELRSGIIAAARWHMRMGMWQLSSARSRMRLVRALNEAIRDKLLEESDIEVILAVSQCDNPVKAPTSPDFVAAWDLRNADAKTLGVNVEGKKQEVVDNLLHEARVHAYAKLREEEE